MATKTYLTEVRAICPKTGELLSWAGARVPGISPQDAQNYCDKNGLGYCKVIGVLHEDDTGTYYTHN